MNTATMSSADLARGPLNVAFGQTPPDKLSLFGTSPCKVCGIKVQFTIFATAPLFGLPVPLTASKALRLRVAILEANEPILLTRWGVKFCCPGWGISQPGAQTTVKWVFTM